MIKWVITFVLFLLPFTSLSVDAKGQEVYIAIGDSLAAGQTPNRSIDAGYADLIAQQLTKSNQLAYYSKSLSMPGYTTVNVLETVRTKEAKKMLENATIVTISAGANDLLQLIQVNSSKGLIAYKQIQVNNALNNVRLNIREIIKEVQVIAPKAKIYIMGYYFAYPHVHDSQKKGIKNELDKLHTILRTTAEANGAMYVSVEKSFSGLEKELLPNPADVHPTLEGYRLMANAFFQQYDKHLLVKRNELPAPNPITFEKILNDRREEVKTPISRVEGMDHLLSLTELKPYI